MQQITKLLALCWHPATRIMPAGPYEGQAPTRGYEEDLAHQARVQLIEIIATGRYVCCGTYILPYASTFVCQESLTV